MHKAVGLNILMDVRPSRLSISSENLTLHVTFVRCQEFKYGEVHCQVTTSRSAEGKGRETESILV